MFYSTLGKIMGTFCIFPEIFPLFAHFKKKIGKFSLYLKITYNDNFDYPSNWGLDIILILRMPIRGALVKLLRAPRIDNVLSLYEHNFIIVSQSDPPVVNPHPHSTSWRRVSYI